MTEYLPHLICFLAGGVMFGGLILWLKSRKTSTKAELMYALAAEAKLLAKMPGASEAVTLAQEQAQAEAIARQKLQEALSVSAQS